MRKRQSIKAMYEKIREIINNSPFMTEEQGFQLLKDFGVDVDPNKAVDQARKRKLAGIVARERDEKGRRKAFASNNDDGETVYTNIENETRVRPLTQIRTRLEHQIKGLNKSYLKARRRERTNISTELMSLFPDIKQVDG